MNTIEILSQNVFLLLFAFVLGMITALLNIFIARKNKWFSLIIPGVVFIPSFVIFVLGLSDTAWSVFPKVLIGAIGIALSFGVTAASVPLLIKKTLKD